MKVINDSLEQFILVYNRRQVLNFDPPISFGDMDFDPFSGGARSSSIYFIGVAYALRKARHGRTLVSLEGDR